MVRTRTRWNPRKHPRWPAHAPAGHGGEFRGGVPAPAWTGRLSLAAAPAPAATKDPYERAQERLTTLRGRLGLARDKRKKTKGRLRGPAEIKLEAQILEQQKEVNRLRLARLDAPPPPIKAPAAKRSPSGPPPGHVRLYHGRLKSKLGSEHPKDPKALATLVEETYGLPEGAVYDHPQFRFQRSHREDDPHYYVAPRSDAMTYARGGGEALGDALRAAFYEAHGIPANETRSIEPEELHVRREDWVRAHVRDFGTIELQQVDVPHDVIREVSEQGLLGKEWPEPDDHEAWSEAVDMLAWPAGIGLTPEQRARTQIKSVRIRADERDSTAKTSKKAPASKKAAVEPRDWTQEPGLGLLLRDEALVDSEVVQVRDGHPSDVADGDSYGRLLARHIGFDALPQSVTPAEFDQMRAGKQFKAVLYRGVGGGPYGMTSADVHAEYRDGPYHFGQGTHANGTYMATARAVATAYSDKEEPGAVARYALRRDARVVDYEELIKLWEEWEPGKAAPRYADSTINWPKPEFEIFYDLGRFAMAKGYDAIYIKKGTNRALGLPATGNQYAILNRGAIIAEVPPAGPTRGKARRTEPSKRLARADLEQGLAQAERDLIDVTSKHKGPSFISSRERRVRDAHLRLQAWDRLHPPEAVRPTTTIPTFELPPGSTQAQVQRLAKALRRPRSEWWTLKGADGRVETVLDNPGYHPTRAVDAAVLAMDPVLARRVAWEADAEAGLNWFEYQQRPPGQKPMPVKQMRQRAADTLRQEWADAPIGLRLSAASLRQILKDGRFKTVFETRMSGGDSKGAAHYPKRRAVSERIMFGLPLDAPPQDRPIYGYLAVGGLRPAGPREGYMQHGSWVSGDFLSTYGEIQVILKPHVRARTTASHGDSIDQGMIPSPVDNPSWLSFGAQDRLSTGWGPPDPNGLFYTEAQIHGGVTLDDIDEVVFNVEPDETTKAALEAAGISWRMWSRDTGSTAHTPVQGRDLRDELDYMALDALPAFRRPVVAAGSDPGDSKGDQRLSAIYERQGFHAKPEVLGEDEMDRRIADGWVELWRGFGANGGGYADAFRYGDEHYAGRGVSTNGTYTLTGPSARSGAASYAGAAQWPVSPIWTSPSLVRMALSPDARIVDEDELNRLNEVRGDHLVLDPLRAARGRTLADAGRLAAALGYDGIRMVRVQRDGTRSIVVLNRSVLAVQEVDRG